MKRSAFLVLIFGFLGVSRAQQEEGIGITYNPPQWTIPLGNGHKPHNNQCPVCGTMAKPYSGKRAYTEPWCIGSGHQFPPTKEMMAECEDPPRQRITRCLRCNAAFWQDAYTLKDGGVK